LRPFGKSLSQMNRWGGIGGEEGGKKKDGKIDGQTR